MDPNGVMIRTKQKQDKKNSTKNQSENSDKECEEVWCDEAMDVITKTDHK